MGTSGVCFSYQVCCIVGCGYNNKDTEKGEGKAIRLQAWTGSEDSRRLRLPDFKTVGT